MSTMAEKVAPAPSGQGRLPIRPPRPWSVRIDKSLGSISLLGSLLAWEVAGWVWGLAWLPPFSEVVRALIELVAAGVIIGNLFDSLKALTLGFGVALWGGLFVGGLMGRYRRVGTVLNPYVYAFFVSPPLVFVPIFFALFGLSDATRVAVIVMYSVFVIIINTATAIRVVDPTLIEMARSFGASRERQIFFKVLIPASLPLVFAGIKLGMGRGVKGMINGEMFIALVGLGALSARFGAQFDASKSFAIALVILIVALVLNAFVQLLDSRLTYWTD